GLHIPSNALNAPLGIAVDQMHVQEDYLRSCQSRAHRAGRWEIVLDSAGLARPASTD
ncbi:MAG: hypothetical protein JWM17_1579, partial [Actinobacteria bacterium]|nr:hypothetical protein [Actinomycetota bacterium]